MKRSLVLLALLVHSAVCLTHPDLIPERYRGGRVYREAKQQHDDALRQSGEYYNVTANTFQQLLDHSNPDGPTFAQRWWVDYSAWNASSDLAMLYINGEAPASSSPTGFCANYGHSKNSLMFTLENRFYGESMPSPLTDYATLSKYLSVDAALEDLRYFMSFVESPLLMNRTFRWFIVGGSYSGALSAWFKQKYPAAVLAAWSSSGVVKAQLNFYDYDGHVGEEIPPVCKESIQNVLQIFESMWDNTTSRTELLEKFNIPVNFFVKTDMSYMLADAAAGAVQYGMKWHLCDRIVPQSTTDPLGQYATMINDLWGPNFANGCGYSTMCLSNKSMSQSWAGAGYSWTYQTCSQLGYFQVGYHDSVRLPDVSTDYFIDQCRSVFDTKIFPDVYKFNAKYGGLTPDATNVIALQGSDDPWSTTGVRQSLGVNYPAVIAECEGCGHCGDLMPPLPTDPPSLVKQRQTIVQYMDTWLSSQPSKFELKLEGNFEFVNNATSSLETMTEAVLKDIRAALDQSATITSVRTGSLIVQFTIQINDLNRGIVAQNIAQNQGSEWLVQTTAAFSQLGGTGGFSLGYLGSYPPIPGEHSACNSSCVIGILCGSVAFLALVLIVAVNCNKRKGKKQSPPVRSTTSEASVLLE